MRLSFPHFIAAAAVFAAAASSFAHGTGGVVDIDAIDERIDAQLEASTGKVRRAYASLARVVRKPSRRSRGMADDMTKLIATRSACHKGPLVSDTVLRDALAAPEAQADEYLADEPGKVAAAARRLERASDRDKVQMHLDAVAEADAAGDARRVAGDELGMLRSFRTAGLRLARAGALVQSLTAKQVRRGSPGQPLRKGPKGTIDTYAGTGLSGFSGDGGSALDATFYFPMDVVAEPATGLVHVADYNNHRIRRIDADGKIRTVADTGNLGDTEGPALTAQLHHPAGIAFHPTTGDLYISGWHVHRIIRLLGNPPTIEHYAGSGAPGNTGDGGPAVDATYDYPSCVAFGAAGDWYVSDQNNARVRHVDAAGTIHALAGNGTAGFSGDDGPAVDAQLANPDGNVDGPAGRCCLDPTERFLYVADTSNHRVRKVDLTTRVITTFAGNGAVGSGGDGGPATDASLDAPVDVDCDAEGNVYVCDWKQDVVRRIDATTNVISSFAGVAGLAHGDPRVSHYVGDGHPATGARLNGPQGIFIDRVRGRLYIADTVNSVIRVVWE